MSRYSINVSADDGTHYTRPIPADWSEVELLPFCRLAAATTLPQRIEALASLLDIPAQPLLEDVSQYANIVRLVSWLLSELPPAGEPVMEFKHGGVRYVSTGQLRTLTAGQLEAIYTMQQAHGDNPLEAAPGILAVLFVPQDQALTPELHQASTRAFAALPLSVAWPALQDFIANGASAALPIATYSALAPKVAEAMAALETALASSSASTRFWQKLPRWALRRWLKSVKQTATIHSNS